MEIMKHRTCATNVPPLKKTFLSRLVLVETCFIPVHSVTPLWSVCCRILHYISFLPICFHLNYTCRQKCRLSETNHPQNCKAAPQTAVWTSRVHALQTHRQWQRKLTGIDVTFFSEVSPSQTLIQGTGPHRVTIQYQASLSFFPA